MTNFVIVTPSYNNEQWVETYVDSIVNQTYDNYLVIYVDDCSPDSTFDTLVKYINGNKKFICIRNEENQGAFRNYIEAIDKYVHTDDVVVMLDGDDWLADDHVLEKLNKLYEDDMWMTYGGMYAFDGEKAEPAYPQNTPYDEFVHKYSLYKLDTWRASHLRTFKKFLWKGINQQDFVSKINNKLFDHASDLCFMYALMEMCPIDKIGVVDFPTYVYNASNWKDRGAKREANNQQYETEIRNKRKYKRVTSREEIAQETLPVINMVGAFRENNSIPKTFSYVYNKPIGDFEITMIQDEAILQFLQGQFPYVPGKIVAEIQEATHIGNQQQVISTVKQNHDKFDLILTCDEQLKDLPNSIIRPVAAECVLNKNIHTKNWPTLADDSLIQIYDKSKLVSCISSNKNMTSGHSFRLECVRDLPVLGVDMFGRGFNEIAGKIDGLKDYMFSVAIENGQYRNYFTEKIIDCFLTGTIPIYHGCPNIGDYFDTQGFYTFETIDELKDILTKLTDSDYIKRKSYIKKNFDIANKLKYDHDVYFERYLKPLL